MTGKIVFTLKTAGRLCVLFGLLAVALLGAVSGSSGDESGDSALPATVAGDDYSDLAVGVPYEDVGSVGDAGAVNVLYGSPTRLSATGNQLWHQDATNVVDVAEEFDSFGYALAAGDFNGDGHVDLAVGVSGETIGTALYAGAVQILYGASKGLTATGNQLWHQGSPGIQGAVEDGDWFGSALAAADFDGDGYADLAVGVPGEDVETELAAGAVNVLYGSSSGLTATGNQLWHQDSPYIVGVAGNGDFFGAALAADDFDHDGYADLAVGVPGEDVETGHAAGAVNVLYGSSTGLTATGNQFWHQDIPGILDTAEADDEFGGALTGGDFDGDGYADLAVGVPYEDVGTIDAAGSVNILYGSSAGLTASGAQLWHQDSSGTLDTAEADDEFGEAVAAGDFDGDGFADLAVGVPGEDIGTTGAAGAVHVLYGTSAGLTASGDWWFHQNSSGISDMAESSDLFGYALAAGDFDGDAYIDLAVGVPGEDIGTMAAAGAVHALYGTSAGLTPNYEQYWWQDCADIAGASEPGDQFGAALTALELRTVAKVYLPLVLRNYQP